MWQRITGRLGDRCWRGRQSHRSRKPAGIRKRTLHRSRVFGIPATRLRAAPTPRRSIIFLDESRKERDRRYLQRTFEGSADTVRCSDQAQSPPHPHHPTITLINPHPVRSFSEPCSPISLPTTPKKPIATLFCLVSLGRRRIQRRPVRFRKFGPGDTTNNALRRISGAHANNRPNAQQQPGRVPPVPSLVGMPER